ncbi:hypothetical protein BSM4216_1459 [Bacillus smithii]|nr:hypothetical protein BSM4216_1459 [Bacillus smithii]
MKIAGKNYKKSTHYDHRCHFDWKRRGEIRRLKLCQGK